LHVLGTPPAFNLSQDQTLHLKILRIIKKSKSKIAPTTAGHFGHSVFAPQRLIDASPHTNYLPNF
jgi:hypothetical protein